MPVTSAKPIPRGGTSRRTVLDRGVRAGLGVLAAPAVLTIIPANAQSRTIKIGHVSPKTGPLAGFGEADAFILEQARGDAIRRPPERRATYKVEIIARTASPAEAEPPRSHPN